MNCEIKFCLNCKFFFPDGDCTHPKAIISTRNIKGQLMYSRRLTCVEYRSPVYPSYCGPSAILFEQKKG